MKTISKTEKVKRWLMSGKPITSMQAISHHRNTRLADTIYRLKNKGLWIINIGNREFAKYILVEKGLIRNKLFAGYRLSVTDAVYNMIDMSEMFISISADNGHKEFYFSVNSEAFRDKKIMLKAIKEAEK